MSQEIYKRQLEAALDYFVSLGYTDEFPVGSTKAVQLNGYSLTICKKKSRHKWGCLEITVDNAMGWREKVIYERHESSDGSKLSFEHQIAAQWAFSWSKVSTAITAVLSHLIENYSINGTLKSMQPRETYGESAICVDNTITMTNKSLGGHVSE